MTMSTTSMEKTDFTFAENEAKAREKSLYGTLTPVIRALSEVGRHLRAAKGAPDYKRCLLNVNCALEALEEWEGDMHEKIGGAQGAEF